MNLFGRKPNPAAFWDWFATNAERVAAVRDGTEPIVKDISTRFKESFPELTFEIGSSEAGADEFIVSADGLQESIPAVQQAVAAAPPIPGWQVIAFRQPKPGYLLEFAGKTLSDESIYFTSEVQDGKLDLILYVDGLNQETFEHLAGACFLLLDATIGEYAVMTEIGGIDFRPLTLVDGTQQPLSKLPEAIQRLADY